MIYGFLNQGSGVGNQLFRYIAVRITAQRLKTDWRLLWNPDNSGKDEGFKCKEFMEFDDSKVIMEPPIGSKQWYEKKLVDQNGVDIRGYDPEFNFVEDNTFIEGEFQDERYWEDYEKELNKWLKVNPIEMPENVCVIGFRGGEFSVFPDLFLPKDYWDEAIEKMKKLNPDMKFEVHTDDGETAKQMFPDFKIVHDININWRSMRYAKYAIIANSSFFILPRWLSKGTTIAPRYWARHNTHVWALPQNYYKRFQYI